MKTIIEYMCVKPKKKFLDFKHSNLEITSKQEITKNVS